MLSLRILFGLTAVLVLAALWLALRPHTEALVPSKEAVIVQPRQTSFDLVVQDGKVVSSPAAMEVRLGDQVMLRVQSNANDELHLHGYELKMPLKAGDTATLQFTATRSGRFELELHKRHVKVGALEVYPK